jgi:hypothetical protein
VVGQDLQARPDDESHKEQVQKMLKPQPGGHGAVEGGGETGSRMPAHERFDGRMRAKDLGGGDPRQQQPPTDGEQPEQVEPAGRAGAQAWRDAGRRRDRPGPGPGIDGVLTLREALAQVVDQLRRDRILARRRRFRGGDHA